MKFKSLIIIIMIIGLTTGANAFNEDNHQRLAAPQATMEFSKEISPDIGDVIFAGILFGLLWHLSFLIPSIVVAVAAHRKGLSWFCFFALSQFFSPLTGFLAVIAMPAKK